MGAGLSITAKTVMLAAVAMLAVPGAPEASAEAKRGSPETGPLIMSGTMVPPMQASRVRAKVQKQVDRCVPAPVKRRPLLSLRSLRLHR